HAPHRGRHRVDGAVRARGHPPLRQGSGALHDQVPSRGGGPPLRLSRRHSSRGTDSGGLAMSTVPRTFNMADVWEMAADAVPEREALVVGEQRRTYAQLEERANRLAHHLAHRGIGPGDHVALYLENCAEYVEAMLATWTLRAVAINVNHRYVAGELAYLLDNSDSVAVLTQPSLLGTVESVVGELDDVRFVLVTGDDYEAALAATSPERPVVPGRGDDDHYIMYTGGTTGMPKGVVWRHADAFFACIGGGDPTRLEGPVERPEELPGRITDQPVCYLPVAPLMHAAAQWTSLSW